MTSGDVTSHSRVAHKSTGHRLMRSNEPEAEARKSDEANMTAPLTPRPPNLTCKEACSHDELSLVMLTLVILWGVL